MTKHEALLMFTKLVNKEISQTKAKQSLFIAVYLCNFSWKIFLKKGKFVDISVCPMLELHLCIMIQECILNILIFFIFEFPQEKGWFQKRSAKHNSVDYHKNRLQLSVVSQVSLANPRGFGPNCYFLRKLAVAAQFFGWRPFMVRHCTVYLCNYHKICLK